MTNKPLPFSKGTLAVLASLILVLALIASRKTPIHADAENTQPAPCRFVLASFNGAEPIDTEIARQQAIIRNGSTSGLERLGWTFVKKARVTFDASYYNLAEQCAACMEASVAKGPDALLLRAHALQSLHRFNEAEAVARELVRTRERPFDYGVLGDVLVDQGKVREGAAAYQKMIDLRPDLQSYARAAHVRWLTGDLNGAIELMRLAVAGSSPNDADAAAWAYTRLSLYQLQHGATKQALESCSAALTLQSNYAPALLARGRVLLALQRPVDAVVELKRGATEDPRGFSLFLATRADDIGQAVHLAQQELMIRRDVFTHDALAWALAQAGRAAEAQLHATEALSEGTVDARLFLHAGIIASLNNDNKQAKRLLRKASLIQQMLLPSERKLLDAWRSLSMPSRHSTHNKEQL